MDHMFLPYILHTVLNLPCVWLVRHTGDIHVGVDMPFERLSLEMNVLVLLCCGIINQFLYVVNIIAFTKVVGKYA